MGTCKEGIGGLVIHGVGGGVFSSIGLGTIKGSGLGWDTSKVVLGGYRCESSNDGLGLVWLSGTGIGDRVGVKGVVWVDGTCVGIRDILGVFLRIVCLICHL